MEKFYFQRRLFSIAKLLSIIFFVTLFQNAFGQLTGTRNIPGDYATLALAITDLNTQGVGAGGVTLNLVAGNPQTAPSGGYVIGGAGSLVLTTASMANPIVIQGNGNSITAFAGQTAGNLNDAVFKFIGADWTTITGFTLLENAANVITTAASNDMTEWGVALLYVTATDGCQNITIQSNTIDLNRTYQNTFGIYSNSTHTATAPSTSATASGATGGNHNLKIYSNTVQDVNIGIVVVGPTAVADQNDILEIGATLANANTITNYGTTGTFSSYANVSGTINGILVRNTKNYHVSYNSITSSNGAATAGTMRAIYVPSFSNAPTGTFTNNINNNTISLTHGVSAILQGIVVESSTGNATSTININENNFTDFTCAVASSSTFTIISNAMAYLNTTINGNTFTNITTNTTGSLTFISNSVTRPANAVCNVNNNSIVTGFTKTGAGGTVLFYNSNSLSPTSVTETNDSNNFSNLTFTGATTINGWLCTDGSTTSPFGPVKIVTNNTFSNITGGTSEVKVLQVAYGNNNSSSNNVSGNVVSNINCGGIVTGITTNAGRQNFFSNTISTITSSGATAVNGFSSTGGTTHEVYGNKIYDISSTNAGGTVNGILISGSVASQTINVYNNLIGDLRAEMASSTTDVVRGINVAATGATSTYNVSFNTVYLNTASTGTNFSTSAIFHAASATGTTATLNLRNNILVNLSTANGSGVSAVYRRSTTALNNYGSVSNNNLLYAGTPGATKLIFYDGTNSDQTLGAYITRVTPRDDASITESPNFLSTTGSSVNFLHIDPSIATAIESGGITVAGITTDYDGNTRNVTTPDIGADEFAGMTLSCSGAPAPSNAVVDISLPACNGQTFTLSLDVSYIAVDYQWQSSPDNSSWSNISGATFSTHITSTSTSTYYRAVITCPSSGMSTNSGSVHVTVFAALSGTYTVDNTLPSAGTNYNNFVDAVAALNCRGISAPVIFNVTPGQTFTSSDSLNITATGTSTNTITFQKNGAGTNPKIQRLGNSATTNYILRLGGGDYFTFDGIDFQQTGTSATDWVEYGIYLQNTSVTEGAKNNIFKNGVVTMTNANTASKGVYVHSSFTPTALTGTNSTNKFLNMTVQNSYEGYRIAGATNTFPDDGNEINTEMSGISSVQTLGDGTAAASLYGIFGSYQTNFKVKNTEISNLTSGGTSLAYGIALQSSTANTAEISGNFIHDITGSGTVTGIQMSSGDSVTIYENTIYALTSATATSSAVRGMDIGGTGLGANIYGNKIYDLSSAGLTTTTVGGIEVGTGLVFNIHNNMVSDLTAPSSTSTTGGTKGIETSGSTAGQIVRIYYNSVLLTDVGAVAGYTSAGFYNSNSTLVVDFRNNIIVNKSDVTTGTRAVAYWKNNTTINQHADTDNNLYYSGSPSAKNLLYYDGTNAAQTISAIQAITGMSPREAFSVTEDVDFDPVTGGVIRPDVATGTLVESGGQLITGYNTDFENQPRQGSGGYSGTGTAPDIGADEFEGTLPSCSGAPAPSNAMVDLTPPLCPGVSFTTSLSTAYTGTDFQWQSSPDNSAWTNIGGAISATYNTTATTTTYYRAVITCPASGMSTGSGSVLVSVHTMLNGTYTIDNTMPTSGTNYNNFSAAIADLHCRGLNGPVIFNVTAGQVFSSSDSLNILATGTSTNTITFQKSGVGANPLVQRLGTGSATNYILRIGGGDYFTFDGINFEQTGSSAADYVEFGIYIQNASATNGAKNNTFKNGIVSMSPDVATTKGVYVHASPSATNVSGTNSSNRFLNMTVQNSFEGYRFSGTSATYQDDGNEIGTELSGLSSVQTLGNGTVTGILGGINATYQQNFAIRNTEISNITAGGTSTVYGVLLSTSASDTTEVSGNHIHNISGGGTVYGLSASSGDSLIVFNNSVYTLTTTTAAASFVRGIDVGGTGMKSSIYDNKIYDLSSSGLTGTSVIGIDIGTGIHNVINNMISDLRAPASTITTGATRGISITGGTSGGTDRIYYNTVLLTDVGTVAGYTSAGIHNSSTTPTLDLRNNIIINKSDVTTGTRAVAFWKTSATDNVSTASNNNLYYAGTPGAKNLIYFDPSNSAQTIDDYKALAAITPGESYSVTEDVVFDAVASGIIRPDQTVATLVESSGQTITGYESDFENDARGPYPLGGQANGGGFTPDLGADEGDFTFVLPPVPDCATLNSPANASMDLCPYQDLTLSWTPAVTGGVPSLGYDIYLGTSPTPPFLANTLMTSYTASGLTPNATYYWKIVPKNPSGDAVGCTTFSFTTSNFDVLTTTPGSRCGFGSVTLGATGTGSLYWFDEPTGGSVLGTGTSFNTPSINATTTFYVGAGIFNTTFGARPAPAATTTTTASNYGLIFDADVDFILESVEVYSTGAGNIVINLTNSAGTILQTATVAVTAAGATTPQTVTLNFPVPAGTSHRLIAVSSPSMVRESALGGFPYSLGVNGEVTSGLLSGGSTTNYYYFYNWKMISGCLTPLEAVTATITPADPILITPSSVMRCPSDPANSITASSTAGYTYTWSPSTGLDTPNGPTVMANPATSTTYTVVGDDGTCANTATVEVIVNNPPSSPMASATPNPVCEGSSVNLNSSATAPEYIVSSITHAPLSGASTSIFITGDDTISAAITLPFTFNYFGAAKTQIRVSSNGWITFNASETSTTNTVVTIPAAGAPNDAIYVLLDDVIVTGSGSPEVRHFTTGSTPNRTFVVEYSNLKFWNSGSNDGLFNAQLHLKESTGNIEIHILDANDPVANTKTIGVENSTGTQAIAPPGRNNTIFNITNASPLAWRFVPNTIMYSWSGPGGYTSNMQNPTIGTATAAHAGLYTVTISDISGCSSTATVDLGVNTSVVSSTSDAGANSLRDVIACAAPGSTITFAPALSGQTITLTTGEIAINKNLTISGLGAVNLFVSGNNASRIFRVLSGNTVNIEDMSLINAASVTNGGAFWNEGTMTLENVIISGSTQNSLPKGFTGGPASITEFLGTSSIND